jgi:hypothetical protein
MDKWLYKACWNDESESFEIIQRIKLDSSLVTCSQPHVNDSQNTIYYFIDNRNTGGKKGIFCSAYELSPSVNSGDEDLGDLYGYSSEDVDIDGDCRVNETIDVGSDEYYAID